MKKTPVQLSASILSLIMVNIIPVLGVLFLDWSLFTVMLLFWAESGVIGFYNILKMIRVGSLQAVVGVPFFVVHYGGFMTGHLVFLTAFFGEAGVEALSQGPLQGLVPLLMTVWPALLVLFLSHGISYVKNFLGRKEYQGRNINQQMMEPYKRIFIMHITIILGGIVAISLDQNVLALVMLIGLKIVTDLIAHLKEHGLVMKRKAHVKL